MAQKDRDFRHQSLQDPHSIVEYLSALKEGFVKGSLQFRDDGGEIVLEPSGLIRFEVAATKKSGQQGLTLKLSWKHPERDERDPGPLRINGTSD